MSITTIYDPNNDCMHFNYDDNPASTKKIEHYLMLFEELWKEKNNLNSKIVIDIRELISLTDNKFKDIKPLNIYNGKNIYYYTELYSIARTTMNSDKAIVSILEMDENLKSRYTIIGDDFCFNEMKSRHGVQVVEEISDKWRLMRLELELQTSEYGIINDITRYFSERRISIYFYSLYDNFYILMNCDEKTFHNTMSYFGSAEIGFTIFRHGDYQS